MARKSPAIQLHEETEAARRNLSALVRARNIAQGKAMRLRQNVSFGIGGDPKFGENSLLYGRFGYTRKSARRRQGFRHGVFRSGTAFVPARLWSAR